MTYQVHVDDMFIEFFNDVRIYDRYGKDTTSFGNGTKACQPTENSQSYPKIDRNRFDAERLPSSRDSRQKVESSNGACELRFSRFASTMVDGTLKKYRAQGIPTHVQTWF